MNKYRAKKTKIDGIVFDSKAEGARYQTLRALQECGEIGDIIVHPSFTLAEKATTRDGTRLRAIKYEADFKYYDPKIKKWKIEDVKGFSTALYRLKKNLFLRILPADTVFKEINLRGGSK